MARTLKLKAAKARFEVIEGGPSREQREYEQEVEERLHHLIETVNHFVESLPAALLTEKSAARELLEELVVKQTALEWIARVAKHSQGAVRERLWCDIEESLDGLERTADSLPRLGSLSRFAHIRLKDADLRSRHTWS